MKKIHLNRQSGMILVCSSCIFDVISNIGGGHLFPIAVTVGSVAHAVTTGSVLLLYKFC